MVKVRLTSVVSERKYFTLIKIYILILYGCRLTLHTYMLGPYIRDTTGCQIHVLVWPDIRYMVRYRFPPVSGAAEWISYISKEIIRLMRNHLKTTLVYLYFPPGKCLIYICLYISLFLLFFVIFSW